MFKFFGLQRASNSQPTETRFDRMLPRRWRTSQMQNPRRYMGRSGNAFSQAPLIKECDFDTEKGPRVVWTEISLANFETRNRRGSRKGSWRSRRNILILTGIFIILAGALAVAGWWLLPLKLHDDDAQAYSSDAATTTNVFRARGVEKRLESIEENTVDFSQSKISTPETSTAFTPTIPVTTGQQSTDSILEVVVTITSTSIRMHTVSQLETGSGARGIIPSATDSPIFSNTITTIPSVDLIRSSTFKPLFTFPSDITKVYPETTTTIDNPTPTSPLTTKVPSTPSIPTASLSTELRSIQTTPTAQFTTGASSLSSSTPNINTSATPITRLSSIPTLGNSTPTAPTTKKPSPTSTPDNSTPTTPTTKELPPMSTSTISDTTAATPSATQPTSSPTSTTDIIPTSSPISTTDTIPTSLPTSTTDIIPTSSPTSTTDTIPTSVDSSTLSTSISMSTSQSISDFTSSTVLTTSSSAFSTTSLLTSSPSSYPTTTIFTSTTTTKGIHAPTYIPSSNNIPPELSSMFTVMPGGTVQIHPPPAPSSSLITNGPSPDGRQNRPTATGGGGSPFDITNGSVTMKRGFSYGKLGLIVGIGLVNGYSGLIWT